jgi:RNA polymerase sigma factor (sigma-70 family)
MSRQRAVLLEHVRRLAGGGLDELADAELLRRYAVEHDEPAFAALVRRHGPMVWHVCRRTLGHEQNAEDAFQAAFLVLARKAGSVRWCASIVPWLYAVAQRVALKAWAAGRRPAPAAGARSAADPLEEMTARELLAALDAELAVLPEKFRGPLVLCWLEDRTQEEAAALLGTSLSTVRRRLERGKRLLQARLARRGLTPAAVLGAVALARAEARALPARTLAAAVREPSAAARALAEALPTPVAGKVKVALALVLAACVAGVGLAAHSFSAAPPALGGKEGPRPPAGKGEPRRDALGDPLPPGALLRLGSIRLRHSGTLQCVAYSPDGKVLASGGWDRVIRLWDPATGKERGQIAGPENGVNALVFSPDGRFLAGGGSGQAVRLWDAKTGKEVRRLSALGGNVRALAFSRAGVLAAGSDGSLRLWQANSGKELGSAAVAKGIAALAFSPDGRTVAGAGDHATVRIWATAGCRLVHELRGHGGLVGAVVFTPDGKYLAAVGVAQTLLWEAATGKKRGPLAGIKGRGRRAAFTPDGKLLAVAANDHVVRLWDWAADREVRTLHRCPDYVRCLTFAPDGKTLACVSDGTVIHLWDPATGRPRLALPGHHERLTSVAYTPDGRTILTAAWDGTVRLWDARSGVQKRRLDAGRGGTWSKTLDPAGLSGVAVSPDSKYIAAVRSDHVVVLWEARTGKEVRHFRAVSVAFSPDGQLLACGGYGTRETGLNTGLVRLYDLATGKEVRQLRGHLTPVCSVAFSSDGRTLVSCGYVLLGMRTGEPGESETRFVRFWDVATGKERPPVLAGLRSNRALLSPDGRTIASLGDLGKTITLLETATGGERARLVGHTESVFGVAFAPDGRTLASGSMDGSVRLWDVLSGKEIGRLKGHRHWVQSVAFAPDGKTLVSGSVDTTGLVWDVSRFTGRRGRHLPLTRPDFASCWQDLGGNAAVAYGAVARLERAPDAVPFLRERLRPVAAPEAKRVARLIAELDSERFSVRERATRELAELAELAAPALREALPGASSAEQKRRLEGLLGRLEAAGLPRETLRQMRAVEALEHIGSAEARRLLGALAGGAAGARLTQEAKSALARLAAAPP